MPYNRYTPAQKAYLKQHYAHLSNAELARQLGIDKPAKVLALARRLGLKWRAENGTPRWRDSPAPRRWAPSSRPRPGNRQP